VPTVFPFPLNIKNNPSLCFFVESETNYSALPDRLFFIETNALNNLLNSFCYKAS
jgi:hypothetical protein